MSDGTDLPLETVTPEDIRDRAVELIPQDNIGLAYTYNEPMIGYEFVYDCAGLIHNAGLKNVVVSNGYINSKPLKKILPLIDAANIDLKAFNQKFYDKIGGDLEKVKDSIKLYADSCHLEITCLIIPGENDDPEQIGEMCKWIRDLDNDIPLHITRFFPAYKYSGKAMTTRDKIDELSEIAQRYLNYVYKGNY